MKIIKSPDIMQTIALNLRSKGRSVGLVPTMGALHKGHISLIKKARSENDIVIVSIFVNPAQFGPNEDYLRYPRPFRKDARVCREAKVDFIFAPSVSEMYSEDYGTYIEVLKLSEILCGRSRPGHFKGVATVVAKLFNITMPEKAYFGMKDYQQLKIIQHMAKDLNFPVKIIPCPIVREKGGLALSSRNQYLSKSQHLLSQNIYKTLQLARDLIKFEKIKNTAKIKEIIKKSIKIIPEIKLEYFEILDAKNLEVSKLIKLPAVALLAVRLGKTRLIDNLVIN